MTHQLRHAARLWGLKTGYQNVDGKTVKTAEKTLLSLLESISGIKEPGIAIHKARERRVRKIIEPTIVHVAGTSLSLLVTLPESHWNKKIKVLINFENGEKFETVLQPNKSDRTIEFDNQNFYRVRFALKPAAPVGYHQLTLFIDEKVVSKSVVLSRPQFTKSKHSKAWGLFAPLYAVRSKNNWGIGDLDDLAQMQEYVYQHGGSFFGVLPLLSAVNEGSEADPSPYSPVSRLFWNEIYLRPEGAPDGDTEKLRDSRTVDYKAVFEVKKKRLQELSSEFFSKKMDESSEFKDFVARQPLVTSYAKFRSSEDQKEYQYHLYVQFQIDKELGNLAARARAGKAAGLYLDFPVGVSKSGFDCTIYKENFILDTSAGAPPDLLFHGGQNWGFAPFNPITIRENGYEYFRKCMQVNLQFSSVLRLDHIMAFYRIYAIPDGFAATEGGYIRYQAHEFFAVLAIEAERTGARVIGEDLGTVPDEVRELILENDCLRMWVFPFEVGDSPSKAAAKIPEHALACLNTHDLIPFAGYLTAHDSELFRELGLLEEDEAKAQIAERKQTVSAWMKDLNVKSKDELLSPCLKLLAKSPAELVLVNIEDLWRETEPQNVPGTWREVPNWQRKLKFTIGEIRENAPLTTLLDQLSKERK